MNYSLSSKIFAMLKDALLITLGRYELGVRIYTLEPCEQIL